MWDREHRDSPSPALGSSVYGSPGSWSDPAGPPAARPPAWGAPGCHLPSLGGGGRHPLLPPGPAREKVGVGFTAALKASANFCQQMWNQKQNETNEKDRGLRSPPSGRWASLREGGGAVRGRAALFRGLAGGAHRPCLPFPRCFLRRAWEPRAGAVVGLGPSSWPAASPGPQSGLCSRDAWPCRGAFWKMAEPSLRPSGSVCVQDAGSSSGQRSLGHHVQLWPAHGPPGGQMFCVNSCVSRISQTASWPGPRAQAKSEAGGAPSREGRAGIPFEGRSLLLPSDRSRRGGGRGTSLSPSQGQTAEAGGHLGTAGWGH